ncbi:hypothetical protein ACMGDH_11180 [Sphingomonas sp. DT-207]|uniref:hypothetical protein n=1 Tax=Sphingomonas sp. DT-207 TaxID=3396167 RepID=UPI003F1CEB94
MSALITINFADGTATSTGVEVVLANCEVAPGPDYGVSVAMASALTNITVLSTQVIVSTATGAMFNGSLAIQISWGSGQPTVTLNNLRNGASSPALVTWPTAQGPQTQILSPGDAMPLSGIVNS